ncbi:MAG: shikimate dehydrogenase [Maritimibacter sp.]
MTDRYAVFGNPLGHTKSPQIHQAFAAQFGEDMEYGAVEAPLEGFVQAASRFFEMGGLGLNVTVPFKTQASEMANERYSSAEICGAANCLKVESGRIIAENFDGVGLLRDVEVNLGVRVKDARILVLGAGGAARGTIVPFLQAGAGEMVIANRTPAKAEELCDILKDYGPLRATGFDRLGDGFDIVFNSTSASLTAQGLPISNDTFISTDLAYDLVYGKGKTPFLRQAEAAGARQIADGVGMLVEQAAEAFNWWRGKRPESTKVIADLTVPLV